MKKSVLSYAFLFSVGQMFAPAVSYSSAQSIDEAGQGAGKEPGETDPENKLQSDSAIATQLDLIQAQVPKIGICGDVTAQISQFITLNEKYASTKKSCVNRQAAAANVCLESESKDLADTMANINMIMSIAGSAAVKDSCSTFAKAMNVARAGLSAYTSACGAMQAGCTSSCVSSKGALESMRAIATKLNGGALGSCQLRCEKLYDPNNMEPYTNCNAAVKVMHGAMVAINGEIGNELQKGNLKAVAGKHSACAGKYAKLLTTGALGIFSLVNSMKQGDSCDKASDGTGTGDADACKVAATANTEACICKVPTAPECVCLKNPRNPGCPGASDNGSASGPDSYARLSGNNKTTMPDGTQKVDLGGFNKSTFEMGDRNPTSEANGAPPPTGGGSAGLGGGGGSGGGSGGDGAGKKGLNANILGGTGGGGGSWRAGGSGAGANSKYRSYLPGGDKDPNKLAGQQSWTKEVTGQGGKSNWEKVKDRYRDNKNTLLNN